MRKTFAHCGYCYWRLIPIKWSLNIPTMSFEIGKNFTDEGWLENSPVLVKCCYSDILWSHLSLQSVYSASMFIETTL